MGEQEMSNVSLELNDKPRVVEHDVEKSTQMHNVELTHYIAQIENLKLLLAEKNREIEYLRKDFRNSSDMAVTNSSDIVVRSVQGSAVLRGENIETKVQRIETSTSNPEIVMLRDRLAKLENENQVIKREKKVLLDKHKNDITGMEDEMEKVLKEAEDELKKAELDMEKLSEGHKIELSQHKHEVEKLKLLL